MSTCIDDHTSINVLIGEHITKGELHYGEKD